MNRGSEINILMIEENIEFAKSLSESLSKINSFPFTLECVKTLNEAFLYIETQDIHVILLDLFLTESKGLTTLKKLRANEFKLPIIVLTEKDDVELAVNAVRFGAQDYLIKRKIDSHLLSLAIRYAVERKRTETFQREQLHFLQSVMDNIPSPLFIKGTDLNYGACNTAFENLMGVTKDKIIGKTVFDIFEEESSELIRSKELELLSGTTTKVYELMLEKNNENVNMVFHETVHRRADGSLAGLIGVAMDITEMKKIQENLENAKANLEKQVEARTLELEKINDNLVKQIKVRKNIEKLLYRERKIFVKGPVVVFRLSAIENDTVEYVSPNIRQYGYSVDDFSQNNMSYRDFIHEDYRSKVLTEIRKKSDEGAVSIEQIFKVYKKDGTPRKVYCLLNVERDKTYKPKYYDGYILDITNWVCNEFSE
ncbi:MAG: PAS domain S-box protein [Victivallales bacterium]|nr:PAS domain S-box protein [Victivallales bacterium]